MRELEHPPEYWAEKRRQHVRSMGLNSETKNLLREEIDDALKYMPRGMSSVEKEGYEIACNEIWKRIRNL